MTVNYIILLITGLCLAGIVAYYKYAQKRSQEFKYKPVALLIIVVLFLLSLYGIIVGKPYNEILPFIR